MIPFQACASVHSVNNRGAGGLGPCPRLCLIVSTKYKKRWNATGEFLRSNGFQNFSFGAPLRRKLRPRCSSIRQYNCFTDPIHRLWWVSLSILINDLHDWGSVICLFMFRCLYCIEVSKIYEITHICYQRQWQLHKIEINCVYCVSTSSWLAVESATSRKTPLLAFDASTVWCIWHLYVHVQFGAQIILKWHAVPQTLWFHAVLSWLDDHVLCATLAICMHWKFHQAYS